MGGSPIDEPPILEDEPIVFYLGDDVVELAGVLMLRGIDADAGDANVLHVREVPHNGVYHLSGSPKSQVSRKSGQDLEVGP